MKLVPVEQTILVIRGLRVILDVDLATLYGTTTKALNQAVRRNLNRFPSDFLFQLTEMEKNELVTNCDRFKNIKHSNVLPSAFTEYGAIMAANVLNSDRAIEMSIYVIRAFIKLREQLFLNKNLTEKLMELEKRVVTNDHDIKTLFAAIHQLLTPPATRRKKIGFRLSDKG